jgi:hypothetical protein
MIGAVCWLRRISIKDYSFRRYVIEIPFYFYYNYNNLRGEEDVKIYLRYIHEFAPRTVYNSENAFARKSSGEIFRGTAL